MSDAVCKSSSPTAEWSVTRDTFPKFFAINKIKMGRIRFPARCFTCSSAQPSIPFSWARLLLKRPMKSVNSFEIGSVMSDT